MNTLQIVIFWLLLVDSAIVNMIAWWGGAWYATHLRTFSRLFPVAKGWTGFYLILTLWIGYLTFFS